MSSNGEDRSSLPEAHRGNHLVLAIWAVALFTAFLFGSTIVSLVFTRQAYEGTRSQVEAIRELNESVLEVRKSLAELSSTLKDAQEPERDVDNENLIQRSHLGDENV